ncbi:MAG: polyprenyl synthetase family protein, partial [Proteobacteria bacterium]
MTADTPATSDTGFTEHMALLRCTIEARLDALLPVASNERDLVATAMRDGALAPGKRMRPILLILASNGLGASDQAALDLG